MAPLVVDFNRDLTARHGGANNRHSDCEGRRSHPRLTSSNECFVQIIPLGIHCVDEPHLPGARPMLHRLLALNRITDAVEAFVPDEHLETMFFAETFNDTFSVLPNPARKVARHPM
jgi:hypothetical protein